MTDTGTAAGADLAAMKLPELRKLAAQQGLKGTSGLRKGELIQAITTGQVPKKAQKQALDDDTSSRPEKRSAKADQADKADKPEQAAAPDKAEQGDNNGDNHAENHGDDDSRGASRSAARRARRNRARNQHEDNGQGDGQDNRDRQDNRDSNDRGGDNRDNRDRDNQDGNNDRGGRNRDNNHRDNHGNNDDHHGGGRRGRRGRRNRNRNRDNHGNNGGNNNDQHFDPEDLQEVAGIADVQDNGSAFIRTTGYRQSTSDVYVPQKLVRQSGVRSGDAVTGQVRANGQSHQQGNGRNRRSYNQVVRVDTINGQSVEDARGRKEFHKLTPLYPNRRLRLETEPKILTTRVIDLVMPIGKGQRALIVSPPKAGKTTILQNIANAIATNNPECYLMVVLVDERPEEVTDMQRSVNGEVIASTFDRPPSEHTAVAELAIERAKRLVEMGQDVVVLLDSITRLGRAYNNSSPASGRILSGGVDSNALYPPKRFLGAARNIEEGGSLTIIATAMVETGSAGDTVIFEEFKGTGNAELKLDRKIAERRVFPAVDVNPSGTRKDELLMSPEEARVMHKLRRILSALDPQQSIDMLIKQLKKTKTNGEFLIGVANSAPMAQTENDEEDYS
ncbi:transcription termination factor Rho [Corynebacterium lujinxingii]|uniref:Transcription termination factor Rho n=1 Tax=Corynebacterium lujinxingii TaxID=2763010 RepID=A0A7H0K1C9_9CORY|nr:transcription termination factor Rho [Corynebacterium lujinxingii]MBC3178554.1 transcription termination factor Rho [Corynebacterium lujinxingii]NNO10513.1 transcription termination factor Rho [Corynebacterium lujinxingii]QNP91095.1 transcription termination factor Rho [Corynebacterium lujinxingii]